MEEKEMLTEYPDAPTIEEENDALWDALPKQTPLKAEEATDERS